MQLSDTDKAVIRRALRIALALNVSEAGYYGKSPAYFNSDKEMRHRAEAEAIARVLIEHDWGRD